jgi:urease accessory protein
MRHAISVHPAGSWPEAAAGGSITLAYCDRHRRRVRMLDDAGGEFLLDLANPVLLAEGDGLELAEGGWIRVRAAEEDVAEVSCLSPEALARIAWHIGNRHMPVQILPGGVLRLPDDHVLVAMIVGQGVQVERRHAPFHPEAGAYDSSGHGVGGHDHAEHPHAHGHDGDHDHDHATGSDGHRHF